MIMRTLLILALLFVLSCAQTIPLGLVWDKNTEPDMKEYNLFTVLSPDSAAFGSMMNWPDDSTDYIKVDTLLHFPYLLATMAHIHSAIDTMLYEFNQNVTPYYLRAYITAVDSAGNQSYIAPSVNVVYVGDREAPNRPTYYLIFER